MNWIEYRIAQATRGETSELDLSTLGRGKDSSDVLTELPQEIFQLEHLTKLNLSGHRLSELPPAIAALRNLRELDLGGNREMSIGSELARYLPNLKWLSLLSVDYVSSVGLPLGLEFLDLSYTRATGLPPAFFHLEELRELHLRGYLGLPRNIERLHNLRSLSGGLQIDSELLAQLAESLPLEALDLSMGTALIADDAAELSRFPHLRDLAINVGYNFAIPSSWRRLRLGSLKLVGNESNLTADLTGIEEFRELTTLSLLNLPVRSNLEGIWSLRQLQCLELHRAKLSGFPAPALDLTDIKTLTLRTASIKSIPPEIARLRNLENLDLGDCPIKELPEELGLLSELQSLWLSFTKLTRLPKALCELKRLRRIDLESTMFRRWPGELNGLRDLEVIDLSRTQVAEIPALAVKSLPRLKTLRLEGCRITSPPPEIVARGTAAIQGYFSALEESPVSRLYEAKLIIIGEGEVGKTCIARKLVNPDFDIEKNRASIATTRGIAVESWAADTDVSKTFKVNIWDFGGQEIYHATHQFFLTKRSLYVFVWEARKEERVEGFDYWLNVIKLLTKGSPVLVVQNKADVRIKEIDKVVLRRKFENIVDFYQVSALTGSGMRELARDVRANIVKLPHVGDAWPGSWSAVRDALVNDARNYMDYSEYLAICEAHGLAKTQADLLSQYLHDLGVILHFQDDQILRETVILKPEWGTNAVYAVLDTKHIQQRKGRFSRGDLAAIWGRTTYPATKHGELLQLMMRFELCFPLDGSHEFIAPELLSGEAPSFEWDSRKNLCFEYHYGFMPAGIMTRFIARNHSSIEGKSYWKNGVVLLWEGTRARITADALSRKVRIAVAGRDRKGMLAIVRREMGHIHRTLDIEDVPQMLPCVCLQCLDTEPFLFEYQRVLRYHEGGKAEMTCDRSLAGVPIEALLSGVLPESELPGRAPATRDRTVVVQGDYYEFHSKEEKKTMPQEPRVKGPWLSGGFYLLSIVVLIVLLAAVGKFVSFWALPAIVLGGVILLTLVGALQLKQDERLSEKGFLQLMALAFRQIPLLGKFAKSAGDKA